MKRFLTSFVILALSLVALGAAPSASAEATCPPEKPAFDYGAQLCYASLDEYGNGVGEGVPQVGGSTSSLTNPGAKGAAETPTSLPPNPANSEGFGFIMSWIMSLFAWLVGVAAITLDNAVFYTVVTMGDYVSKLTGIGIAWRVLRDIGNILLIFGFIFAGISIILNTDLYGYGKKMLPMLLVAAVFINFSLFISEAVIDVGNLFATQFYTQINGGNPAGAKSFNTGTFNFSTSNEGISNKIMEQVGLQTIYGDARTNKEIFKAGNTWVIGFMAIILFLVTAFVMFSLAFILIARFVILLFLIILAPIGFAGLAVPKLASTANKWWGTLFEQTITAPVLLLLLYIALLVITDASFLTGLCSPGATTITGAVNSNTTCTANWLGYTSGNLTGFSSMILGFLIAMGLLLAVVIISKRMSAFGADKASALAGKLTFGATAWGMRSTVGAGSQRMSQFVRRKFGSTKTGRVIASTFDLGAKGSFDIRGATAFGGLKATGIDAGKAEEGGYRKHREDVIKGHQEYIKSVTDAIDERGATRKEEERVAAAKVAQENAGKAHETAKQQLEPKIEQQKAEVERLKLQKEQEENASPNGTADPETERKLDSARQNLKTSEDSLKTSSDKLAQAAKDLAAASKASGDRISGEKSKAQLAYAENIRGSFPGWVMYGPGGAAAAKKIIKDAGKTSEQRQVDALMDLLKKNSASTATPTPPSGGAPHP